MALKLFCVHDVKASRYSNLFTAVSTGVAIRMFTDIANDKETNIGRHPEDYTLYYVGDFSEQTGQVEPCQLVPLSRAIDLMQEVAIPLFDQKQAEG